MMSTMEGYDTTFLAKAQSSRVGWIAAAARHQAAIPWAANDLIAGPAKTFR
jgi:hypothetical protein